MKTVILYSITESYRVKLAVALKSFLEAHKDCGRDVDIIIQSADISDDTRKRLSGMVASFPGFSLKFQNGNELVARLKAKGFLEYRGNYSCYKFFDLDNVLAEYPDDTVCLICDADTYVQGSVLGAVDALLESGKILAMVREPFRSYSLLARERFADWNTGFVAINVGLWRKQGVEKLLYEALDAVKAQEGGRIRITGDQALMTMLCYKHIDFVLTLPPKYNFLPALHLYDYDLFCRLFGVNNVYEREAYEQSRKAPSFVHMIGGNNFIPPWHRHGTAPYRKLWLDCLRSTPFAGDWQEEATPLSSYLMYLLVRLAYKILPAGLYASLYKKAAHI